MTQRATDHTRRAIVNAALDLFLTRDYGEVTMEEIAVAAGVSRRTVYRRFPTKDHVIVALSADWLDVWDTAVVAADPAASSWAVAETAALAVAEAIDQDAVRVRRGLQVVEHLPWLASAFAANDAWTPRLVGLLTDPARGPVVTEETAVVIAGAYLGAIDAMLALWYAEPQGASVRERTLGLLELLSPVWPV